MIFIAPEKITADSPMPTPFASFQALYTVMSITSLRELHASLSQDLEDGGLDETFVHPRLAAILNELHRRDVTLVPGDTQPAPDNPYA